MDNYIKNKKLIVLELVHNFITVRREHLESNVYKSPV